MSRSGGARARPPSASASRRVARPERGRAYRVEASRPMTHPAGVGKLLTRHLTGRSLRAGKRGVPMVCSRTSSFREVRTALVAVLSLVLIVAPVSGARGAEAATCSAASASRPTTSTEPARCCCAGSVEPCDSPLNADRGESGPCCDITLPAPVSRGVSPASVPHVAPLRDVGPASIAEAVTSGSPVALSRPLPCGQLSPPGSAGLPLHQFLSIFLI